MYCFWTGSNPLTQNRQRGLDVLRRLNPDLEVVLVTPGATFLTRSCWPNTRCTRRTSTSRWCTVPTTCAATPCTTSAGDMSTSSRRSTRSVRPPLELSASDQTRVGTGVHRDRLGHGLPAARPFERGTPGGTTASCLGTSSLHVSRPRNSADDSAGTTSCCAGWTSMLSSWPRPPR